MPMIKQFYRPTGKVDIPSLLLVPLVIIPLWVISFLYAGILIWNPFHFLNIGVFIIFGFVIAQLIVLVINVSNTRNARLAKALTWILSLLFIYFSWANFFTISSTNSWPLTMLEPHIWWQTMIEFYSSGAHSTFGVEINGFFGAIIWLLEAVILVGFCLMMGVHTVEDDIYCETCRHWVTVIDGFYVFGYEDQDDLIKKFNKQELSFLESVEAANSDKFRTYAIDITKCTTCSDTDYMTLRRLKKGEENEKVLVKNIKASPAMYEKLNEQSKHWVQYSESGKYSLGIWLGLPIVSLLIFGLFWLYQQFCLWVENAFFTSMAFFMMVGVLNWLVVKPLHLFKVRNNIVSSYYGLILAGISVYLLEMALFAAASNGTYFSYNPNDIWIMLHTYIDSHVDFEWYKWTGLMIEACAVFIIPVVGGATLSKSYVYCENCKEWAEEKNDLLIFDFKHQDLLISLFTKQKMDFLDHIEPVDIAADKATYYRINANFCPSCDDLHVLTLESVVRTRTADGDNYSFSMLIENMVVNKSTYDQIAQKREELRIAESKSD